MWQAHGPDLAADAVRRQAFGGTHWNETRTTGLRLSLPALLHRARWGEEPGRERILGVWLRKEPFESLLQQGVLDERDDALYGSVRGHRLATRWAQVLLRWEDDVDLEGQATGRQTPRIGLRQHALCHLGGDDVLGVEDWTDVVRAGPEAVAERLPQASDLPLPDDTLRRLTGGR